MDVCLINNHLPDFSFMLFSATLQLGSHDCHNSTRKCWNKLKTLHTVQSLVWQWNARENQNFTAIAAFSCALAVMLAMATKVTQISLMVSVALGKHQIAQQLLGYHCSVRSEKQTAMAENSFDWCWRARCTKNAFALQMVEDIVTKHNLCILNDSSSTYVHPATGSSSCLLYTSPSPRD